MLSPVTSTVSCKFRDGFIVYALFAQAISDIPAHNAIAASQGNLFTYVKGKRMGIAQRE